MADHSLGGIEFLRAILPDSIEVGFAAVTYLGDPWVMLVAVLLFYWYVDREAGLTVLGVALAVAGVVLAGKSGFALGRPTVGPPVAPAAVPGFFRGLYAGVLHPGGGAFPSGHAAAATVTWGALATVVDRGSRRGRYAVAGTVAVLVATSRVVLGVHYVADVVAGVALGLVAVGGLVALRRVPAERLPAEPVTVVLGVAVVTTLVALPMTAFDGTAQVMAGGAVGSLVFRRALPASVELWSLDLAGIGSGVVGLLVLVGAIAIASAIEFPGSVLVVITVGIAVLLALPLAVDRARGKFGAAPGTREPGRN